MLDIEVDWNKRVSHTLSSENYSPSEPVILFFSSVALSLLIDLIFFYYLLLRMIPKAVVPAKGRFRREHSSNKMRVFSALFLRAKLRFLSTTDSIQMYLVICVFRSYLHYEG